MSTFERISLRRTEHGWVATDEQRDISSAAVPTREEALADLDENVALADGELELSDDAQRAIAESEGELERDETVPLNSDER